MYKDEDKRKEAGKERQRRYRNKAKGVTIEGVTDKALPLCPYCLKRPILSGNAIACEECSQMTLISPKRGKDIKTFNDLPLDVQQTIDRMSDTTEEHIKRTEAAINYQLSTQGL